MKTFITLIPLTFYQVNKPKIELPAGSLVKEGQYTYNTPELFELAKEFVEHNSAIFKLKEEPKPERYRLKRDTIRANGTVTQAGTIYTKDGSYASDGFIEFSERAFSNTDWFEKVVDQPELFDDKLEQQMEDAYRHIKEERESKKKNPIYDIAGYNSLDCNNEIHSDKKATMSDIVTFGEARQTHIMHPADVVADFEENIRANTVHTPITESWMEKERMNFEKELYVKADEFFNKTSPLDDSGQLKTHPSFVEEKVGSNITTATLDKMEKKLDEAIKQDLTVPLKDCVYSFGRVPVAVRDVEENPWIDGHYLLKVNSNSSYPYIVTNGRDGNLGYKYAKFFEKPNK